MERTTLMSLVSLDVGDMKKRVINPRPAVKTAVAKKVQGISEKSQRMSEAITWEPARTGVSVQLSCLEVHAK